MTLSSASWIIFGLATLALTIYGVRNRRYISYPCTIEKRFELGVIGWAVLGVGLLMINFMVNPPQC